MEDQEFKLNFKVQKKEITDFPNLIKKKNLQSWEPYLNKIVYINHEDKGRKLFMAYIGYLNDEGKVIMRYLQYDYKNSKGEWQRGIIPKFTLDEIQNESHIVFCETDDK